MTSHQLRPLRPRLQPDSPVDGPARGRTLLSGQRDNGERTAEHYENRQFDRSQGPRGRYPSWQRPDAQDSAGQPGDLHDLRIFLAHSRIQGAADGPDVLLGAEGDAHAGGVGDHEVGDLAQPPGDPPGPNALQAAQVNGAEPGPERGNEPDSRQSARPSPAATMLRRRARPAGIFLFSAPAWAREASEVTGSL